MPGPKQSQAIAALKAAAERNLRRVWRALPPEQRKQIRKVAHPANLAKLQRTAAAKPVAPLQRPQLAVIVLLTDDAGDPAVTLRSLVGQQPAALELIVVDTSLAGLGRGQVREFAKRDGRVKYLALAGSREEAARGRAVAQSRAPYLMFLTAGDVVEKASLDPMLAIPADERLVLRRRYDRNRQGQNQLDAGLAAGHPCRTAAGRGCFGTSGDSA